MSFQFRNSRAPTRPPGHTRCRRANQGVGVCPTACEIAHAFGGDAKANGEAFDIDKTERCCMRFLMRCRYAVRWNWLGRTSKRKEPSTD
jgi:hypothetical protein